MFTTHAFPPSLPFSLMQEWYISVSDLLCCLKSFWSMWELIFVSCFLSRWLVWCCPEWRQGESWCAIYKNTGIPNTAAVTKKGIQCSFWKQPHPPVPPTLCVKLKSNNALIPLAAAESHATLGPVMELGKFCTNRSSPLHSPALCCGCRGTAWESWCHGNTHGDRH